ncbi:serine hydrolase domain-containing protein [Nocardia sp. NPDC050712]|uniref:serine hydrolase domain-containing protein n=1 Tax=Nocardia sp. NPDC050712 TaxID=3155518 RepID=UPI0033FCF6E1
MRTGPILLAVATALSISACTSAHSATTHDSLQTALEEIQRAGVVGVFAEVRTGEQVWRGASGVADLSTGSPVTPDMRQRVGSITKTFIAVAIMQQVEQGRIRLDAPIGDYLPELVPGERGRAITVRMLINHTSGIPDLMPYAFPSLAGLFGGDGAVSAQSLDDNRFRVFSPAELIAMGLNAPAGEPGALPGVYSNTNYFLLGQLLESVTGSPTAQYLSENIIRPAGLEHTSLPDSPYLEGPHPKMYEGMYGVIDPPRDYSVYDMSWTMPGAGLVSTMSDLNRFYAALLAGKIVNPAALTQMQQTVPVIALDGQPIVYGLGLHRVQLPGCEVLWGHDGSVFGAATMTLHSPDGRRQLSVAMNSVRGNKSGAARIENALSAFYQQALCGPE